MIAAQDDYIRLDAQATQLFDGMLRGLGLNLVRGGDVGHQRNVDAAYVLGAGIFAVLADRLDKRLALDVANGAAQLGDDHVGSGLLFNGAEAGLDGVGHVRNHLHGTAQKVAAALASDQVAIDRSRGEVGIAGKVLVDKTLVMTQVKVGLIAVLSNKDLTMLVRAHGARVNVEIRVGLLHGHLVSARFKKTPQRSRGNSFSQRGDNAARYKHMLGHRYTMPFRLVNLLF